MTRLARGGGPLSLAGMNLLLVVGCTAGPVHLRIDTGGKRYQDFVVRPATRHGFLESSRTEWLEPIVVASEEELTLPRFDRGPTVSTYGVWVYHPEFATEYTGAEPQGEMRLPPVRPRPWSEIAAEEGPLTYSRVAQHLSEMNEGWLPAFPLERRAGLARYLPGLRELAEGARMGSGDASRFETERAARGHLERQIESLAGEIR